SQSWMGSDLTNEDLVREVSIVNDYDHKMLGDSTIEGRKCWKLELVPHEDVPVVWGKIHVWVDQQDYLQMLIKYYDEDGYLVNVMTASNIQNMGGRPFTQKMTITPVEEEGHSTILEYQSLKFDGKIPDAFFSVQNMKRVR
ncbi:MAG: outer membrane lipoprotein-sorting protein, partial [Bacteroidota bacterium]